jgi:subfamily B ATP-binding cassette protein MsbA
MAASERIFHMLDTHTEVKEREDARPLKPLREHVEFRNVAFAYDDAQQTPILRDVSFRVAAGQVVAIVGLSGAGKTTLVNLIPRFYDVTAGAVLIDGVDVRDVTLRSLRAQVGIVTQETVLFDETIAVNIAYGSPAASQADIEAAARAAHAHEFILGQPQAYETRIGERGQKLSGGQRQRIAIARALLKNSPILILDEATSALDAESEQLVQDALANLMRNRTAFVIAHRLSTVRRADVIVALERGHVAEIGRHDELLANPDSVYAKLYALQAFEREPDTVPVVK